MAFTPPPTAPQRGDRATFSSRVDAFLTWMVSLVGQLNQFLAQLTSLAVGGSDKVVYAFATATTAADPGAGFVRFNNATQNLSTELYVSNTTGGVDWTALFNSLQASTSTIRATLRITKLNDPSIFMLFSVTNLLATSGYRTLQVSVLNSSSASPFAANDTVAFQFQRTGDKGDAGTAAYPTLRVVDQRTAGTGGGDSVSGTNNRVLNATRTNTITGASLTSSQITLPAGKYKVAGSVPAYNASQHQAFLTRVSDGAPLILGTTEQASNASPFSQTRSIIAGEVTLAAQTVVNVTHYILAATTLGLGTNLNSGQPNIFTEILFEKVG